MPAGSLQTALAHTARLLDAQPALAEAQAREILAVVPDHPHARVLLASALRRQGRAAEARGLLDPLAQAQPKAAPVHFELGMTLAALGEAPGAIAALRRAVALQPEHPHAWRALGDVLGLAGDSDGADAAYARHLRASVRDPKLVEAATALCDNSLAVAERILRPFLAAHPTDVGAIRMLAEVAARLGRYGDAETLLERAMELAPGFDAARHNHAVILYRLGRPVEAVAQIDRLLAADPDNASYLTLKAAALGRIGEYQAAIDLYERVLAAFPDQPKGWMSYGHSLKTVGRADDCVAAYRKAVALSPHLGEAWWSLANLKTFRFTDADVAAMTAALARPGLAEEDRFHLRFALGKALEDAERFEASFEHYAAANALRREGLDYDADTTSEHVRRSRALFTAAFFAERQGRGCPAPDPIFVVGLPRAGSTLIEQILSSHSQVEGTMELPDIIAIAKRLGGRRQKGERSDYPEVLTGLDGEAFAALGRDYVATTRVQRKTNRPLFVDKMPNNWAHAGLIHLILPNARIIDARRHPLACGFSGFKQHFARGQGFTYDLADIGRYYGDYVELMAHFDAVLPGRIHRVEHEAMLEDPEGQIRALLDHCGLSFEDACLRFHETDRAVRTASSEQVRRPISREGAEQWRNFEPWLGPLKAALPASIRETYGLGD